METIKKIKFNTQPIMFVAWPDLGNVGIVAVEYIRKKLNAEYFAKIDISEWYTPDAIVVKGGVLSNPSSPECHFYFKKDPDIIIFESNIRLDGKEGVHFVQLILQIALLLNVKYIFTAGGITRHISLNDDVDIKFISNNEDTRDFLLTYGLFPLPYGEISGLKMILLTSATKKGLNVAYFQGKIPAYANNWILAYPKLSLEIIRIFTNILGVSVDYSEFYENTKAVNDILEVIDAQMQGSYENKNSEDIPTNYSPIGKQSENDIIPDDVINRIERMFTEVSQDKSLAMKLKRELDKWKLFRKYEKRFLDLFKS